MSSERGRFFLPDFLFCQNTSFCKAFIDLPSQEEVGEAGYSLILDKTSFPTGMEKLRFSDLLPD
jgi:hypothetical protein